MPKVQFPSVNYQYKRYLNAACIDAADKQQCYYNILLGEDVNSYINVIADIWNTSENIIFPELCDNFVNIKQYNPEGVSIAVSGGGSRSYTCMIGYVRALLELEVSTGKNAFTSSQFISSVSGGSWFTGTYLMAKGTNKFSDMQLLGVNIEPQNIDYITLNTVNFNNTYFMGQCPSDAKVIQNMENGIKNGVKSEFLWNYAIGQIFLSKYGLFGGLISQNSFYADKMIQLNPSLSYPFLPPQDCPFWICNATLLDTSTINNGSTQIQFTPLYSGLPQILGSESNNDLIGGSWVNTYAFGSLAPMEILKNINCNINSNISLKVPTYQGGPLTIENMIGTSSSAYAFVTYDIAEKLFGQLVKLDPIYNFICPKTPFIDRISYTGDGAIAENTGIISLIARNCKYIIAFNNTPDNFETSPGNYNFCNSSLLPLFGLYSQNNCSNTANQPNIDSVQIFDSSLWASFSQQFISTSQSGGPSYARAQLPVLPNPQNGIKGNYMVDLLVISLQPSTNYNALLPSNITNTFSDKNGPFPNFPNYSTIDEDIAKLIQLTKPQINLLQCYTYWSIKDQSNINLANEIINMYQTSNIF
jgi:hypothetical protein